MMGEIEPTKTCKDCGETFPRTAEHFHCRNRRDRKNPEWNGRCKPCHAAYLREHRRLYSNSIVINNRNRKPKRRKMVITSDTKWQIALHLRYPDHDETREIVTGNYGYLRPIFDKARHPQNCDFRDAVEVYMALEAVV